MKRTRTNLSALHSRPDDAHAKLGFSTIEVMVMVAIVAVSLVPIMTVQSQVVRAYSSYKDRSLELTLTANSLELLTRLNPALIPDGSVELDGSYRLSWQSSAASEKVAATAYPSGTGDFEVSLFRIECVISKQDGSELRRFYIDRLGWSKLQPEQDNLSPGFGSETPPPSDLVIP